MRNVNFRTLLTDRGHFTRCQGILYPVILSFSFLPIIMTSSTQKVPVLLTPAAAVRAGADQRFARLCPAARGNK